MKLFTTTIMALVLSSAAYAAPYVNVSLSEKDDRFSCGKMFKGVINPQDGKKSLKLKIETNELVGKVKYKVMYTNNGYKNTLLEKYTTINTNKSEIKIPYYEIKDDAVFAVNQVFVTATDSENTSVATSFTFRVYRSLVLEKSTDNNADCFTMYKSEKITGVYANTTASPRRVAIEDRLTRSTSLYKARNSGWSFRLSPFNIAHLGYNKNYIKNKGQGLDVSTAISVETSVAPGESIVLTRQMTLYKDLYNVKVVGECGQVEDAGTASYSHWTVAYPVAVLDMSLENPFEDFNVGYDDEMNTCVEETEDTDIYAPETEETDIYVPETTDNQAQMTIDLKGNNSAFNELGEELNSQSLPSYERSAKFKKAAKKIMSVLK